MELKERILQYMRHDAYKPLDEESIAEALDLTREELVEFWPMMEELEENASIIKTRAEKYGVPERMNLVVGRLSMTGKGFGFVIPDLRETDADTDVFIPGSQLAGAMHNDRVVVRINEKGAQERSREGEVIRIVKRANVKIVGTFESSKSFGFVTPDDTKINQDIFIPKKEFNGAKIGMKVVVEVTKWPEGRRSAEGRIIEVIGKIGDPGVDILSVIHQYDLPLEFPPAVQSEADKTQAKVSPEEYRGRRDRRDFHIVTIDGDDAKDLDDGVYVERRENGSFFLGVYIADVSYYVKENAPLDLEARARGTSVYLVDRVIPMLPTRLSNGICSLNAGEDRLAMAAEMEIGADGQVISYEILPTVIHVYRRLTYNIVNKMLVDEDPQLCDDNADILPMLKNMEALRNVLKKYRSKRGSIDFDLPEVKVKLDEKGKPVALLKRMGSLAESMIEQCMLQANETVAEHMDKKMLPFIYRVHEQPNREKIDNLNLLLATFGLHINKNPEDDSIRPLQLQKVLEQVQGRPEERIISSVSLRSMQQARYEAQSLGHFGLAARYYTHFTSPIRRYPDLIVHRLLRDTFKTGTMSNARQEKLKTLLPQIATLASQRERIAIEAERETVDMKKIEYMAQYVGEEFDGIISGVKAFGIFIELDNGVEGLVHVSSMENDYYEYVPEQYALVGQRMHNSYRLGDAVHVILVNANVEERNIDFILKDNGVYVPAKPKKQIITEVKPKESPDKKKNTHRAGKHHKKKVVAEVSKSVLPPTKAVGDKNEAAKPRRKRRPRRKPGQKTENRPAAAARNR
jgi:ribonuclease R